MVTGNIPQIWLLSPAMADIIQSVIRNKVNGFKMRDIYGQASIKENNGVSFKVVDGNGVIPIHGVIGKRFNLMDTLSGTGGCSLEIAGKQLVALASDPDVKDIYLDMDTPGGTLDGVEDFCYLIEQVKKVKPVYGFVNSMACSAGYWIVSHCTKVLACPRSDVGSIGVYIMHIDESQKLEDEGIKVTFIKAGERKVDGNSTEPLSERAMKDLQDEVNKIHEDFIIAVAKNRGLTVEAVRKIADGSVYEAGQAMELGLIDEIQPMNDLLFNPSNIYKGEGNMFDKKLKDTSLEEVRTERKDLVESIEAPLKVENERLLGELNALKASNQRAEKIRTAAAKDQASLANELCAKPELSTEDALLELLKDAQGKSGAGKETFYAAAPKSAGNPADNEGITPKDKESAILHVRTRDNCSKAEAVRKAMTEFGQFWGKE